MAFNTTLIIGLGGIGSGIVENIYRKFDASNPSITDRDNVAFLCLDTDEADIKKRREVMPASSVVKTSSDLSETVGGYVSRIQNATTVLDWFDTRSSQMLSMPLNEGAAQIRMASRLAAISAIDEGKFKAIDNSITKLFATDPARHAGNDIKIHIVTSLAGGTGAGSFLQVAYYVKDAMRALGALAPKINGYFILADVLCDEMGSTFGKDQRENVRSNTYACIKELMAFSDSARRDGLQTMLFEYKLGQRNKKLPDQPPYDTCFMIDFTGSKGGNLQRKERYYDQATSFVYANAFDPLGDNYRSKAINDVRQLIDNNGASRFASFGVSKLVYPVDDMMSYFALRRVSENLGGTWLRIDNDFKERWAEYKKKRNEGIPAEQPDRGVHFREQVDNLAKNGAGREGAEFRQILQETQLEVKSEGKPFMEAKSKVFLENVDRFVSKVVSDNQELAALYAQCTISNPDFTSRANKASDIEFVVQRERALDEYRNKVVAFIDNNKSFAVRQCLVADHDQENYVSKNPLVDTHHLNTYILQKDNEMHLLYDIQYLLKNRLSEKKALADRLEKQIMVAYPKLFDNPETKDQVEGPTEHIETAFDKHTGAKKIINTLSGQNPYKTAKEFYAKKSKKQAADIQRYSTERLLADTYAGLLGQVNQLSEALESFFASLPMALGKLQEQTNYLLNKHDNIDDPAVSYVLAAAQHKKDIYDNVVSADDSPFFPPEMAAALYRSLYHGMVQKLDTVGFKTSRKANQKELEKAAYEANQKIIDECVVFQTKLIREKNSQYSAKNVLDALDEEAMRECDNDREHADEYMRRKFNEFRDRAEIWGPGNLDTEVRYINAWGLNPACLRNQREKLLSDLFGESGSVGTNDINAATRISSDQFSPYELLRVNVANLLTVEKNFRKFCAAVDSVGFTPTYYQAYQDVIAKMGVRDSRTYSPHLDKHWHLPAYMPNIGQSYTDEVIRLFRALYSGLLFDNFTTTSAGGDFYWKYKGSEFGYINDSHQNPISIGKSQPYAIDRLFAQGLTNNPRIVDDVLALADAQWAKWRDDWQQQEVDESNELDKMLQSAAVRHICDYRFNICKLFPADKGWFTLLDTRTGTTLHNALERENGRLRVTFYDDLIQRLLDIFGPSANTRALCEKLFQSAPPRFLQEAQTRIALFEQNRRFVPIK